MRVLGVDPGTYATGVGVVDAIETGLRLVHCDALSGRRSDALPERLLRTYKQLLEVIENWRPVEVAVEQPFVSLNWRSAMAIGQAQAVAFMAAAHHGLPVSTYLPSQVKQSVTDHGGSSKEQVQEMVKVILEMPSPPESSDAADALAVAICHINARRVRRLATWE